MLSSLVFFVLDVLSSGRYWYRTLSNMLLLMYFLRQLEEWGKTIFTPKSARMPKIIVNNKLKMDNVLSLDFWTMSNEV